LGNRGIGQLKTIDSQAAAETPSKAGLQPWGATVRGEQVEFRVWAPAAGSVRLRFEDGRSHAMQAAEDGVFQAVLSARPGERYFYQLDEGQPVPDPVSRLLPEGVHGPTEIVAPNTFPWTDQEWRGLPLGDYLIYELHTGTFSPEGTFEGVRQRLEYLKQLGITVIELMPVAAFPGRRNWGYDGVSPYAVQTSYGGPEGLRALVDAAHRFGLAILLDVVYNHLGAEGNYLSRFGPYFTDRHQTPWGDAINYDSPGCEGVRRYFVENALYWVREYHLDGLRLDAIQTIKDDSRYHIVEQIRDRVHDFARASGREICVIAETDENDARLLRPKDAGGLALDAVWSDDFHHAVHTLLTGESSGYYQDFGRLPQLERALRDGFVFQGEYFQYWKAPRGTKPEGIPLPAHVICIQNHDQIGNRAKGARLRHLVPRGARWLAAALLLQSPATPLLFMGEEYDESAPFQFFTDYGDPQLQKAVSEGRRREFQGFSWKDVPDPQDPATFERSRLHWELASEDNPTLQWYRRLIALRKRYVTPGERTCKVGLDDRLLTVQVPEAQPQIMVRAAFSGATVPTTASGWNRVLSNQEDGYAVEVCVRG
jgi:maltooligosyltrehalose trehalohydrolase